MKLGRGTLQAARATPMATGHVPGNTQSGYTTKLSEFWTVLASSLPAIGKLGPNIFLQQASGQIRRRFLQL